jgi:uncharacterized membrane protein YcaP (DUF421 family)
MDIVFRAVALYFFVFIVVRKLGRRQLSTLAPFDLVLLIVLGDAIQQGLTQDDYSVTGAIIAVSTIALLQVATTYVSFKSPRLERLLEGEPLVLMQDGEPIQRNLRRERLTVGDLAEEARLQQIASLATVKWAVLETNGKISFIPGDQDQS